jgi:hypothetical protein
VPHPVERPRVGWRKRTEEANPTREHDPGCFHADEQRDLCVPPLGRPRRLVGELVAIAVELDDLIGDGQADATARELDLLAQPADRAQELEGLVVVAVRAARKAVVDVLIRELRTAADDGSLEPRHRRLTD